MKIPREVAQILETLTAAGYVAYVVGGCVRDVLMGRKPGDWDVATNATPDAVKRLFLRTADTGIAHGTVTVLGKNDQYEVTTFRCDGEYLDGRRPVSVTFADTIEEDLSRRDFTMNAVAWSPERGFVDPYDGVRDIERAFIRAVGDARRRFAEDALRMLRAVRFASVLGFETDSEIITAIREQSANLANVSTERIRDELGKLLLGDYVDTPLQILENTGLRSLIFRFELREVAQYIPHAPKNEPMRLALLFSREDETTVRASLRNLRYDNKTIDEVAAYIAYLYAPLQHEPVPVKQLLRILGADRFENLLTLRGILGDPLPKISALARDIIAADEPYTLAQLAVTGDDLKQAGIPPGREMGAVLERLLLLVMADPAKNTKDALLHEIKL